MQHEVYNYSPEPGVVIELDHSKGWKKIVTKDDGSKDIVSVGSGLVMVWQLDPNGSETSSKIVTNPLLDDEIQSAVWERKT